MYKNENSFHRKALKSVHRQMTYLSFICLIGHPIWCQVTMMLIGRYQIYAISLHLDVKVIKGAEEEEDVVMFHRIMFKSMKMR